MKHELFLRFTVPFKAHQHRAIFGLMAPEGRILKANF